MWRMANIFHARLSLFWHIVYSTVWSCELIHLADIEKRGTHFEMQVLSQNSMPLILIRCRAHLNNFIQALNFRKRIIYLIRVGQIFASGCISFTHYQIYCWKLKEFKICYVIFSKQWNCSISKKNVVIVHWYILYFINFMNNSIVMNDTKWNLALKYINENVFEPL